MDIRDFKLSPFKPHAGFQQANNFSPFTYIWLIMALPFLVWYLAGETLHRMALQWAHAEPASQQTLSQVCQLAGNAMCKFYVPVAWTHTGALILLIVVAAFMWIAASLPSWPQRWQSRLLPRAAMIGGFGLLITLLFVITRGALVAMAVWFVSAIWLHERDLAPAFGMTAACIALLRIEPYAKMAWKFFSSFTRRRTGREVARDECPQLWDLIDQASARLGVGAPTHLVLGVFPDCRLDVAKLTLDPDERVIKGKILYLGITLTTTLQEAELLRLIEHALLRSRGKYGAWLPAVEDWLESSELFLKESREQRAELVLGGGADPAIACWGGWLLIVKKMLEPFKAEHAHMQKIDIEEEVAEYAPRLRTLLKNASTAYKKDAFILFIVNLTSGVECPAVMAWYARAFARQHSGASAVIGSTYTSKPLNDELILLEKEWLIKTGQASTPTDCWELRAA